MKKIILSALLGLFVIIGVCTADGVIRWDVEGQSPRDILDQTKNKGDIKDVKLHEGAPEDTYGKEYRISNTLDRIRINITPYLRWIIFLGLGIATILIIINGLIMLTTPIKDNVAKVKTRMMYIGAGIGLLTGFYLIFELIMSVLSNIL